MQIFSATQSRVGRKKEFPIRITLPLADGMTDRIDVLLSEDEVRLDFIREREIKRRERKKPDGE